MIGRQLSKHFSMLVPRSIFIFHLIHCGFWSNKIMHYFPPLICPSTVTHLISSVDFLPSSSPLLTKYFSLFPCLYLFLLHWPNIPLFQIVFLFSFAVLPLLCSPIIFLLFHLCSFFSSVYQIFTFAKYLPTLLNIFSAHEIYFFAKNPKIQSSGKIIQNLHSLLIFVLSDT